MARADFIEKLTNTEMFSPEEAEMMANVFTGEDYEELCNMMYFATNDLEDFNLLVGDNINRDFTREQMYALSDIMDEEW